MKLGRLTTRGHAIAFIPCRSGDEFPRELEFAHDQSSFIARHESVTPLPARSLHDDLRSPDGSKLAILLRPTWVQAAL